MVQEYVKSDNPFPIPPKYPLFFNAHVIKYLYFFLTFCFMSYFPN